MSERTNWQIMHARRCIDRSDIVNAVGTKLVDNDVFLTLTQVRDLEVRHGEARLCLLQGQDMIHFNQLLMGTIGIDTLEWLQQRRPEHSLDCPMCIDVDCDNTTKLCSVHQQLEKSSFVVLDFCVLLIMFSFLNFDFAFCKPYSRISLFSEKTNRYVWN